MALPFSMRRSVRSITNFSPRRQVLVARGSLWRSISGEWDRCGAGHRADGCLVTDEELHSTLEAQIALHRRARSDDDARNIVEYMQPTGRFLHQNAAFHTRCASNVHAAVDRLDSAS